MGVVYKGKSNNSKKQMNMLSTVTTPIKIAVIIENRATVDVELDTGSIIPAVPIKGFSRIFLHHKMFPPDV